MTAVWQMSHLHCINQSEEKQHCYESSLSPLPCIVLVNDPFWPYRKLKRRRTRTRSSSKSLTEGGGLCRRACPSQCQSAIHKKMIQEKQKMYFRLQQSCPVVHLCPHQWETVLKAVEVLCPLQKTPRQHIPPLDSCAMSRRGSPKAKEKSLKVCKIKMAWL